MSCSIITMVHHNTFVFALLFLPNPSHPSHFTCGFLNPSSTCFFFFLNSIMKKKKRGKTNLHALPSLLFPIYPLSSPLFPSISQLLSLFLYRFSATFQGFVNLSSCGTLLGRFICSILRQIHLQRKLFNDENEELRCAS